MKSVCPLCSKSVSEWQETSGKAILVAQKWVHIACAMDHDLSVSELEAKVRKMG